MEGYDWMNFILIAFTIQHIRPYCMPSWIFFTTVNMPMPSQLHIYDISTMLPSSFSLGYTGWNLDGVASGSNCRFYEIPLCSVSLRGKKGMSMLGAGEKCTVSKTSESRERNKKPRTFTHGTCRILRAKSAHFLPSLSAGQVFWSFVIFCTGLRQQEH